MIDSSSVLWSAARHPEPVPVRGWQPLARLSVLVAAGLLSACGSTVKLDDAKPAPVVDASPAASVPAALATDHQVTQVNPPSSSDADAANGLDRVVYFDFDSYLIKDEFRPVIQKQAQRLSAAHGAKVVIEGHTDERGGHEYNLALGQKRADAVEKSMELLGVAKDQMEAVSFGAERPAVSGSGEEVWAKNRRAEIKDR